MGFMRHVGNAAYWAVFGTTWDNAGKSSSSADPNCPTCNGRGSYGGLRAFPGDPGSGVAPIRCGCRKPEPQRNQRTAPAVEPNPDPAGIGLLEHQLFSDPPPDPESDERRYRMRAWRDKWNATVPRDLAIAVGWIFRCCGAEGKDCTCGLWDKPPLGERLKIVYPDPPPDWQPAWSLPPWLSLSTATTKPLSPGTWGGPDFARVMLQRQVADAPTMPLPLRFEHQALGREALKDVDEHPKKDDDYNDRD